jgi:hypothetical protein
MEIKEIKNDIKKHAKFICETCDFKCWLKSDWERHIMRQKHINGHSGNKSESKKLKKTYFCECGKEYNSNSGLWKHKKTCIKEFIEDSDNNKTLLENEIIMTLIKENSELKNMMMEVIKNGTHNTNTTNNSNNNKTFNLQFFLNEQCKDAINITDFVNSIQLQIQDLEQMGQLGYVDGISNVVIKNLNNLYTNKRPIHCSDVKREVLYIKEDGQWVKDNETKDKIKSVIKQVAHKNIKQIPEWVKMYPDCVKSDSKKNDTYLKIVSNSMSGSTEEEQNSNINKIVSKVAKEIAINK